MDVGDKFVRKLYEMTVNNEIESIDNDEIEKEIVIEDKVGELLALGIAGRASGALSHKLFAA